MRSLYPPMALALITALSAGPAMATQFTYVFDSHASGSSYELATGDSASGSGRLTATSGSGTNSAGLSVTATAWNGTSSTSTGKTTITQAQLGIYDGGLGVISGNDNYNGCGVGNCGMHQIDNVGNTPGSTSYDFVQLTFSQAVTLVGMSRYAFGQVLGSTTVYDDDASYGSAATLADIKLKNTNTSAVLTGNTTLANSAFNAMFDSTLKSGDSTTPSLANGSCNANQKLDGSTVCYDSNTFGTTSTSFSASTTWWISAALLNPDTKSDAFKLYDFKVVYNDTPGPVPEPASWAMMITGFGFIGSAMRRKKAAERLVAA